MHWVERLIRLVVRSIGTSSSVRLPATALSGSPPACASARMKSPTSSGRAAWARSVSVSCWAGASEPRIGSLERSRSPYCPCSICRPRRRYPGRPAHAVAAGRGRGSSRPGSRRDRQSDLVSLRWRAHRHLVSRTAVPESRRQRGSGLPRPAHVSGVASACRPCGMRRGLSSRSRRPVAGFGAVVRVHE
jgi:hypothetical protein